MRRAVHKFVVIVIIFILCTLLNGNAIKARGGVRWFHSLGTRRGIDRVCRDGAELLVVLESPEQQPFPTDFTIQIYVPDPAEKFDGNPDPNSDPDAPANNTAGTLLGTKHVEFAQHNDSILDVNGQQTNFYGREVLLWSRNLKVGTQIADANDAKGDIYRFSVSTVEPCYFNQPTASQHSSLIIGGNQLLGDPKGFIAPQALVYQLGRSPDYGQLAVAAAPIKVNDLFTQADVNANKVAYIHNGTATPSDLFTFTIQGTVRASNDPEVNFRRQYKSANGRYCTFSSDAIANCPLASDETNQVVMTGVLTRTDIFVRDTISKTTVRISNGFSGGEANGNSYNPVISDNGRFVAFESEATNLLEIPETSPNHRDVYLYDRDVDGNGIFDEPGKTQTIRVSIASDGTPGNGDSSRSLISDDGSYVAFDSLASNLVPSDTNGVSDVFVHYVGYTSEFPIGLVTAAITKTVGTRPHACATGQSLKVAPRTSLYYCLTIQNTGAFSLTNHIIDDPDLKLHVTLPYTLGPGAKVTLTNDVLKSKFGLSPLLGPVKAKNSITNTVYLTSTVTNNITSTTNLSGTTEIFTATASSRAVVKMRPVVPPPVVHPPVWRRMGPRRMCRPPFRPFRRPPWGRR